MKEILIWVFLTATVMLGLIATDQRVVINELTAKYTTAQADINDLLLQHTSLNKEIVMLYGQLNTAKTELDVCKSKLPKPRVHKPYDYQRRFDKEQQ